MKNDRHHVSKLIKITTHETVFPIFLSHIKYIYTFDVDTRLSNGRSFLQGKIHKV